MALKTLRTSALKIWANIKNSQPWQNPNVRYRTILRVSHMGNFFICPWLLNFSQFLNNVHICYLQNVTCENDFFFRICWCLKFLLWYLLMLSKFENRRGRMFIRLNQNISDAQSCWNFGRSNTVEPEHITLL